MKTGMASMIEQMNKKFGANKPANVVATNNTTNESNPINTNTNSDEAINFVPSGASTIASTPKIGKYILLY